MIFVDIISYIIAILLSFLFYSVPINEAFYTVNWVLILGGGVFFIISIYNYEGYKIFVEFSQLKQISSLLKASLLTLAISIIALFIFQVETPSFLTSSSRLVFIVSLIILPIIFRQISTALYPKKHLKENILVFGAGDIGQAFVNSIKDMNNQRFNFVGFIDDQERLQDSIDVEKIIGTSNELKQICIENDIDRIIIAVRNISKDKVTLLNEKADELSIQLNYLPSLESFIGNPGKLKEYSGIPLVAQNKESQTVFYIIGKRILDLLYALMGMLLTIPIWLIIPIMIKKDSKGPVFFKHTRIGINGKEFQIYKFRSMLIDMPKYAYCPTDINDSRVTKVGRWLRKTSLDELPQLINIIKGDMGIVGPRPEMPFIVNEYNDIERKRLLVKPGLTGLWQVSPYRNSEINHNLEYDFYYIENQGFILDFVILVMTAFFVVRGLTH